MRSWHMNQAGRKDIYPEFANRYLLCSVRFVFDDYVWKRDAPYANYNGKLIPSRVPTSALIAGPIAGQPYSNSTIAKAHPRAVSRRYFEKVCPIPYILDPRDTLSDVGTDASALQIMSAFSEKLRSINDSCVEIQKDTSQLFDYWCAFLLSLFLALLNIICIGSWGLHAYMT